MLGVGFIGAGDVAESYAAALRRAAARGLPVRLQAVCAARPARAEAFARRHGLPRAAADPAALLADPAVGAVAVLSPMPAHPGHVRAALEAGRHVFCEKALAPTAAEGRALAALAAARGLMLAAAPAVALSPAFAHLAARIAAGGIGRPVAARAIYGWAGPDWAGWFYRPEAGPLRDLGIYALTTLTGLLGPVRAVQGQGLTAEPLRRVAGKDLACAAPDTLALTLVHDGGAVASLMTGFSFQRLRGAGLELHGTAGSLWLEGQDWAPGRLCHWANAAGHWREDEPDPGWHWTEGLIDLCTAVLEGRPPRAALSHALHVLDVIDAANRALATGGTAPVTGGFDLPDAAPDAAPGAAAAGAAPPPVQRRHKPDDDI